MPRLTFDVILQLKLRVAVTPFQLHSLHTCILTASLTHCGTNTLLLQGVAEREQHLTTPSQASRAQIDETMAKKQANGAAHQLDDAVHSLEKKMEEQAELHARNPQEQKEAGLGQLVICVGGIYASL
jgi:hypothetical protein